MNVESLIEISLDVWVDSKSHFIVNIVIAALGLGIDGVGEELGFWFGSKLNYYQTTKF